MDAVGYQGWSRVLSAFSLSGFAWSHTQQAHKAQQAMACCQCQLLVSVSKVPRWLRGGQGRESSDCPLLCIAHLSLGSTVLAAAAVPGKSRLPLERIVRDLGVYNTSFRIKELIPVTLLCINEVVEQKPGTFPRQQNTACDFALMPLLVLQWGFPVISCLFSTLLFFPLFPQQGGLLFGV